MCIHVIHLILLTQLKVVRMKGTVLKYECWSRGRCVLGQGSQLCTGSVPFYSAMLEPAHPGLQKLAAKFFRDFFWGGVLVVEYSHY